MPPGSHNPDGIPGLEIPQSWIPDRENGSGTGIPSGKAKAKGKILLVFRSWLQPGSRPEWQCQYTFVASAKYKNNTES